MKLSTPLVPSASPAGPSAGTKPVICLLAALAAIGWGLYFGTYLELQSPLEFGHWLSYADGSPSKPPLSLHDQLDGVYAPKYKQIDWLQYPQLAWDDNGVSVLHENSSYFLNYPNGTATPLITFDKFVFESTTHSIDQFVLSNDLSLAILVTNWEKQWRHSSHGQHWIFNVSSGSIEPLIPSQPTAAVDLAVWSPDSQKISFVLENNVYLRFVNAGQSPAVVQYTSDGGEDIIYGKPDWVYEEEVFEGACAMWWSPDGEYLAFLKTNDSQVPVYPLVYYEKREAASEAYPQFFPVKYPKAGYPNPQVDMLVLRAEPKAHPMSLQAPAEIAALRDPLFTEVLWLGCSRLLLRVTDRESSELRVWVVEPTSGMGLVTRKEHSADGWFEITQNTLYVPADKHGRYPEGYIDTVTASGYNHLAFFNVSSGDHRMLTCGPWEVVDAVAGFDPQKGLVYFFSTEESPVDRHLYSVSLETGEKQRITPQGEGWFSATFSAGARFALLTYGGPELPFQQLVDLHTGNPLATAAIVEDNAVLNATLNALSVPEKEYYTIQLEDGSAANVVEIRPADFDPAKKYPVLFYVYGGPGSQTVAKSFTVGFQEVVSSVHDAIVVSVDGRGTGFMGREFRTVVRKRLGQLEPRDQITAARYFAALPYVDETKIAIWGWSYGGYMTLKTLETDGGSVFSYGMSVAPVTDWRFYDSIYTERYMLTPENNEEGYRESAISDVARIGQCTRFLLMHGTGDDNVHFQNSLAVLDKLNLAGIENYDLMVFPDSDHAIFFHNARQIVFDKLLGWIGKAFNGDFVSFKVGKKADQMREH